MAPFPLNIAPVNQELEVVEVINDNLSKRLSEIGFYPTKIIKLIKSGDPSIIAIDDSRFALSPKLMEFIYVKIIDKQHTSRI